jgi:uncharacterized protein YkwD
VRRRLLITAMPLVVAGAAAGPAAAAEPLLAPARACPGQNTAGAAPAVQRAVMACMVRWARRAAGVAPGRVSRQLGRSAQLKANLIARCHEMSHTPCGVAWDRQLDRVGFRGLTFENIAAGGGRYGTARGAMTMWLRSPGHRQALLEPRVTVFGVGLRLRARVDGWRASVWTLHLGRP